MNRREVRRVREPGYVGVPVLPDDDLAAEAGLVVSGSPEVGGVNEPGTLSVQLRHGLVEPPVVERLERAGRGGKVGRVRIRSQERVALPVHVQVTPEGEAVVAR